jgi:hypothetical protein
MPTEIATFISGLDSSLPADATDPVGEADDHLRLLKATIQASFPNITGAMTATHTALNNIAGINGLTTRTPDGAADTIPFYDASAGAVGKVSITDLLAAIDFSFIDHDNLTGFVASEHVNHGSVSITAGTGLTGGGTIAASRSLALDTGNSRNVDHNGVSITAGAGLTGGGSIAASRTINVGAGNGITANANDVAMSGSYTGTFTATEVQATSDRSVKADICELENPLELLRAMRGLRYWRTDTERFQYGVIAQEHARVQPEAVSLDEESGLLAVSYNQIIPVLIEALKAAVHRIEMLEQE